MKSKFISNLKSLARGRRRYQWQALHMTAILFLTSCAHLASLDRSNLNRKSMDLSGYQKAKTTAPLTQLSGLSAQSQSAGCSVCAH